MYPIQMASPRLLLVLFLAALAMAGASGCGTGSKPTEPGTSTVATNAEGDFEGATLSGAQHPESRGFYPLDIGNRWTYLRNVIQYVRNDSCPPGECPVFATVEEFEEHRELVGTVDIFGRDYVVEEQKYWNPLDNGVPDTVTSHIRYRQDRAGLYEAVTFNFQLPGDMPGSAQNLEALAATAREPLSSRMRRQGISLTDVEAAGYDETMARLQAKLNTVATALAMRGIAAVPGPHGRRGGALENELTRLKYPLRPGQHWNVSPDLPLTSEVIRKERLHLPAGDFRGYKIELEWSTFSSRDRVFLWYSREGLLKLYIHVESEYTDYEHPYGNGCTIVYEEHLVLKSLDLVEPT